VCDISSIQELSNVVTIISAIQFPDLIQYPETWPNYLNVSHSFGCPTCDRPIDGNLIDVYHPVVKFFEFSPELSGQTKFRIHLTINNTNYSLIGALIRFKTHRIAVSADIEAMFLQIKVADQDKDSLRFLWKEDINNDEPPDTYQMQVHIFGAKDSPSIANYAVKTLCKR